ncbi:flippase-like domain-containing protein [bacterium]|jgi:uncharacterized protein (TIRG00374 family)|nr:flippase-like domain-containing protein [bacterium]
MSPRDSDQTKALRAGVKTYFKIVLKISVVAALLYFLAAKGFLSISETKKAFRHWQTFAAISLLVVTSILGATRWQWLLQAQGIRLKWTRVFQLAYIGNFFNIALPGAVSGDFVKAIYISKEIKKGASQALGAILLDRILGLSALMLVSALAMVLDYRTLAGGPLLRAIRVVVIAASLFFLAFYSFLFLVKEKKDPLLKLLVSLQNKFKRAEALVGIYQGLRHFQSHRAVVAKALLLSIVVHVLVAIAFMGFAYSLGARGLDPLSVMVIVPIGLLVTAVPVAPAGVGTGHVAFTWLFQFLGTLRGADIYSLFAFGQLFIGMLGGFVYLRFKAQK